MDICSSSGVSSIDPQRRHGWRLVKAGGSDGPRSRDKPRHISKTAEFLRDEADSIVGENVCGSRDRADWLHAGLCHRHDGIYLLELLESVPYSTHAASHAQIVAECSRRRKAIAIGQALMASAFDATVQETQLMESAVASAMKLSEMLSQMDRKRPRLLPEHVLEAIETYRSGGTPGVWWGLPELDQMIGGAMPGEMIVVGARPSHGKDDRTCIAR